MFERWSGVPGHRYDAPMFRSSIAAVVVAVVSAHVAASPASAEDHYRARVDVVSHDGLPMSYAPLWWENFAPDGSAVGGGDLIPAGTRVVVRATGQEVDYSGTGPRWARNRHAGADCAPQEQVPVASTEFVVVAAGEPWQTADPANVRVVRMPQLVYELTEPTMTAEEFRALDLVNAERAKNGLQALAANERLAAVADARSTDGDIFDRIGHALYRSCAGPDLTSQELGVSPPRYGVQEVAHMGSTTPEDAIRSLLNSPPHREAILYSHIRFAGVARVGRQWTIDFASEVNTTGPLPSRPRVSPSTYRPSRSPRSPVEDPDEWREDGVGERLEIDPVSALAGRTVKVTGVAARDARVSLTFRARGKAIGASPKARTVKADGRGRWAVKLKLSQHTTITATAPGVTRRYTILVRSNPAIKRAGVRGGVLRVAGQLAPAAANVRLAILVRGVRSPVGASRVIRTGKGGRYSAAVSIPASLRGRPLRVEITSSGKRGIFNGGTAQKRL